jgi:hypothetical protein
MALPGADPVAAALGNCGRDQCCGQPFRNPILQPIKHHLHPERG